MAETATTREDAVTRMFDYLQEADQARAQYIARADLNNSQYLGSFGDDVLNETKNGHSCFIINKTQPACMTQTQVQTEQDPYVGLSARERGRGGQFWIISKALLTIQALAEQGHIALEDDPGAAMDVEGQALADEVMGPDMSASPESAVTPVDMQGFEFEQLAANPKQRAFEVTESFLQRIQPLMAEWQSLQPDPLSGQPQMMNPVLKPTDIVEINDEMTSDVIKNNCDILWDKGNNSRWLFDNIHLCNIVGWQFALYQFNPEDGTDSLINIHPRHLWLPPEATCIEDADYAILREPMSSSQAITRYPQFKKKIEAYIGDEGSGTPGAAFGGRYEIGGPWSETTFRRNMIDVWTMWERGQRYPMSPDEALDAGRVEIEDGAFYVYDEDDDRQLTNPKAKNWPMRSGVKQTVICAETEIESVECSYWDIPIVGNRNIPIPFRWVGQGEPERLEWLDRLIMKLASSLYDIVKFNRSPQLLMPDDVWEALKGQREVMNSHPNRLMHIDGTLYDKYKNILAGGRGFYLEPSPFPQQAMELLKEMLQLHDVLSGNTGVLQGRPPSSDSSGVAIESLQQAARGIIGFKSTNTEAMLTRLTRLRIHAMCQRGWLRLPQWKKMNDKYPLEVLDVIRQRAKQLDIDVKVEVVSGSGEVKRQRQDQVRADRQAGLIDLQTALEKLDYDSDEVLDRLHAEAAAMQPQQQPPMAQAA